MISRRQKGFTMVELLVAVAISGSVTVALLTMTTQMLKSYRRIRGTTEMLQNATMGLLYMSKYISAAYWHGPLTPSETNKPKFMITNDPTYSGSQRLNLHAIAHNGNEANNGADKGYDLAEFGFAMDYHSGQSMTYINLRQQNATGLNLMPDADVTSGGAGSMSNAIAFSVKEFKIQALDGSPLAKSASWDYASSGGTTTLLPRAVRVTLKLKDPEGSAPDLLISADIGTARQ